MNAPNMTTIQSSTGARLPTVQVAKRYGVCSRTIERWEQDAALEFPVPLMVNRRKYWSIAELESWERRCARGKAEAA